MSVNHLFKTVNACNHGRINFSTKNLPIGHLSTGSTQRCLYKDIQYSIICNRQKWRLAKYHLIHTVVVVMMMIASI